MIRGFSILLALAFWACNTVAGEQPNIEQLLDQAIAGAHREPANVERDRYRHPKETLLYFKLKPQMRVIELWAGSGWYTEILAPVLKDHGKLVVSSFGTGNKQAYRDRSHRALQQKLASDPEIYEKVDLVIMNPPKYTSLGPDNSADLVLTFRNTHNWINDGIERDVYKAVYRVLKPGGVFGVVQHRGENDWNYRESAKKGYVPQNYVITMAQSIGFRLQSRSDINANNKDTKDYPKGVWTLPPTYRMGDVDREKYQAIGESDRMTLRFVK